MPHRRDQFLTRLARFPRETLDLADRRPAAVAIVLSVRRGRLTYILTRRGMSMRRGAGNYALPGGGVDPGEDAIDAALRETAEELGVILHREMALGLLDDFLTLGGHVVTPVVFWSPDRLKLAPDPIEVHKAWFEPVDGLNHPDAPRAEPAPGGGEPILRMFANRSWINPPTAAWLYQFREVCLHDRHTRVGNVGQPGWTAR